MKVNVDQDLCIGCEACTAVCPKVFEMYPNSGFAYAVEENVPKELEEEVREATDICPVDAIIIEE